MAKENKEQNMMPHEVVSFVNTFLQIVFGG